MRAGLQITPHKIFFRYIRQEITLLINTPIFRTPQAVSLPPIAKNLSSATPRRTQISSNKWLPMWARLSMQASPRTRSPPTIQRKYRYPSKSKSNSKYRLQAVKEDATLCCRTRIKHRIVQFRSLSHRPLISRQQLCRYSQGMRVTSSTAISQRLIAVRSRLIRNRVRLFPRHPRGRNLLFRI